MESCFSLLCNQIVNQVSQWLCLKGSYIHNLPKNLSSLEKSMEMLKAKRDDVQRKIYSEEFTGRKRRLAQVEVWLKNVMTVENQVSDLLSNNRVELQRLCLCSFCSRDLKQSYRYGKSVIMMLREIKGLGFQGEFDVVTEQVPMAEAEELPIHPTIVGQETLLERVWNHLMEDEIGIVGLYGMGGVGKTTLLTQINNKFTEIASRFDVVIWIVVSNGATIHKIQGDIAGKLGLRGEAWDQKEETERALDIHNVLRRRKFVMLLDDIWEKVNLKVIGIPYPNRTNGCKVAFTTRSREVCARMGVDNPIKVNCLDLDKAWDLFQSKVGVNTMRSHPDIPELARKVSSKCRGLPLALNVIGETMAYKTTIQEWRHAIDVLTLSTIEFSGMENEILPILKYSYDNLKGDQIKLCFLYCSLFPEDCEIVKERLIDYWICEGFIDDKEGRERALNQGYEILGTLVRTCLLLNEAICSRTVSMHDVVREMAMWITSDFGKHKDQCIVQSGVGLRETPKVKNWAVVKRMSLMNNKIKKIDEIPVCPQLTTLLLKDNCSLLSIHGQFFRCMPKLLVLDLSCNYSLIELPEDISELVSLRYLDLSHTSIKRLPIVLQALKMLIHLNLEETRRLENLNGISNVSNLRVIRLRYSKTKLDMNLTMELELLEHLEYISITISQSMIGEQWFYDSRAGRCVQDVVICPYESVRTLVLPTMVNLRDIRIAKCGMWDIKIKIISSFLNLSSVSVTGCNGLKDLTWLMFAPNLTILQVSNSTQIEDIISKEKEEKPWNLIPFKKLEYLELSNLTQLKSIYWRSLPFPCLKEMVIKICPNLKKLPLNSQSVVNVDEFSIIHEHCEEWKEEVEWEDEASRLRFLSSFSSKLGNLTKPES